LVSDYRVGVALDYFAEVSDQLLPSAEPNEKFFRLLLAVLEVLRSQGPDAVWCAVTYFSLWAARLSGWLPDLRVCLECGTLLDDPEVPERAFFSRGRAGLICGDCRRALAVTNAWELAAESRAVAQEITRLPVSQAAQLEWPRARAADLRRFLVQQMEAHVERRLVTVPLLEAE